MIAPSTSRTRFDVSAERGLTPFVGRERERELLLDAFERTRSGSLAEHFKEGGDYEKAAYFFHLSARRARRASAYLEAIASAKN